MRTAPPQKSGRAGDKANSKARNQRFSTTVASPVQALTHVSPTWRRLGAIAAEIIDALRLHGDFAVTPT